MALAFRTMTDTPLTRFEGYVRCMRRERLNLLGAAAIDFACPGFLPKDPSPESQKKIDELAQKLDALYVERRPPRRFSGDETLPAGRYYSLAKDSTGRDGFTIQRELLAYLEPERTGWVWVADLSEQAEVDALRVEGGPRDELALLFRPRTASEVVLVTLPLVTQEITIEQSIDLRRPETQMWFFETFRTGDGDLLRKPNGEGIGSFMDMLPALMWPELGGGSLDGVGAVTRAIGTWMRLHEVSALVFPSARANAAVKVVGGNVVEHYGWNMIDYRCAGPTQWSAAISHHIHDFAPWPRSFPFPVRVRVAPDDSPFRGSWEVIGVEEGQIEPLRARLQMILETARDAAETEG